MGKLSNNFMPNMWALAGSKDNSVYAPRRSIFQSARSAHFASGWDRYSRFQRDVIISIISVMVGCSIGPQMASTIVAASLLLKVLSHIRWNRTTVTSGHPRFWRPAAAPAALRRARMMTGWNWICFLPGQNTPNEGLEPSTIRLRAWRSTDWASPAESAVYWLANILY